MNSNGTQTAGTGTQPLNPLTQLAILPGIAWPEEDYASIQMRLDLFDDMIVATRYDKGRAEDSFVADPLAVAQATAEDEVIVEPHTTAGASILDDVQWSTSKQPYMYIDIVTAGVLSIWYNDLHFLITYAIV